jgi:hypothetical protein
MMEASMNAPANLVIWIFAVALMGCVIGLVVGLGNPAALTGVCVLSVAALVLILLPGISNIKLSLKGFEIQKLAETVDSHEKTLKQQASTINRQEEQITEQQKIINELVKYSLSEDVYSILWRLRNTKEYKYSDTETVKRWCNTLLDHGYIEPVNRAYTLSFDAYLNQKNLVELAKPAPAGEFMIQLRGKALFVPP